MTFLEVVLLYMAIGAAWSWGTNSYNATPGKHDFVLSMATWPLEVGVLVISYIPMLWEEATDKYEELRAKFKK